MTTRRRRSSPEDQETAGSAHEDRITPDLGVHTGTDALAYAGTDANAFARDDAQACNSTAASTDPNAYAVTGSSAGVSLRASEAHPARGRPVQLGDRARCQRGSQPAGA